MLVNIIVFISIKGDGVSKIVVVVVTYGFYYDDNIRNDNSFEKNYIYLASSFIIKHI